MWALCEQPGELEKLRADPASIPGLVEEAVRWTVPVQHFMRTAAEDTEVGGQKIAKGAWLMINYVAANHDPAQFDNPRKFDAARSPNRHLAFGAGTHRCVGAQLARMEAQVVVAELAPLLRGCQVVRAPWCPDNLSFRAPDAFVIRRYSPGHGPGVVGAANQLSESTAG